jgi:hypothetical protein
MTAHKNRKAQIAILAGLIVFTLALCALVVVMMLLRGPAVSY